MNTALALWTALLVAAVLPAHAQSQDDDVAPARGQFEAEPAPTPAGGYRVPDVPRTLGDLTSVTAPGFTFKMGLVALLDYTAFRQDDTNVAQVGKQDSQWQVRAARLMARGTLGEAYKVAYLVAAEYKGFSTEPTESWSLTDLSLSFPLGSPATKLTVGKTKQSFSYEMVGDAANLPQQERVLNPFFVSRSVGMRLNHVVGDDHRMTLAAGIFNTAWLKDGDAADGGTQLTARVTGLVWDEAEGKRFLHLGLSGRQVHADSGTLRYRGRPETNVGDHFVDTGTLKAGRARQLGLEALWNEGPFSVLAEAHRAWVDAPSLGKPAFSGFYVTGSWMLTGETRPYDRTVGYARRVMPRQPSGALELVARVSHLDLDDGTVTGGHFNKTYLGLNWWASQRWKLGAGWGHTRLHRFGSTGVADSLLLRMQWVI